jgi:hypothetical protein
MKRFFFDLQLFASAPSGELTSIMCGKESVFGTAVTPTATHIADSVNFAGSNETLERPGATKAVGQNDEPTGMFLAKYDLSLEPDPDNFGSIALLTMGAEAFGANANNPTVPGGSTTLNGATVVGATTFTLTSVTGYATGNGFRIDAGLPTQEDFIQTGAPVGNVVTVTTPAKYNHANAAAVTPCTLAYDHTFSLASPRLSATWQINRILESLNLVGAKVSQLQLNMTPKQILQCKLSGPYANEAVIGSPTSPTYSVINPPIFEQPGNALTINGVVADATCMGWQVQVNTGVVTDYPKFGNGRFPSVFPENKTVVTLSLDMAYETTTQERNFWGGQSVTGPQATVPSFPLTILVQSPDAVNAGTQYKLALNFGKCKPISAPVPAKAKDYLKQTIKFKVYMSTRGANDDLKMVLTNASNAASL